MVTLSKKAPCDLMPALRENLNILAADSSGRGESWLIQDPVRNLYFQIGWREFCILARWRYGDKTAIAKAVRAETTLDIDEDDVEDVRHFLEHNELLALTGREALAAWLKKRQALRQTSLIGLVQKGLFLRIPLLKQPEPVLRAIAPLAAICFRPRFWMMVGLAAVIGGYSVLRQWEEFFSHFGQLASLEGATYSILAIILAKILHEFGHAATAHHYGLKVRSMGIAFMVFWPILYSDTTDSWQLFDRRRRLSIAAAGILSELALASFALFAWGLLPEGVWRESLFILASVTWLMTLAINLNPLMKFDGYYLLSDWLEIDNLHPRAFAMGKWFLREQLFGIKAACPEADLPRLKRNFLIFLCYAVWVYRVFLTLGIAYLIYTFFFKLLGVIVMVLSLIAMLGIPVSREIREIWMKKDKIKTFKRPLITAGILVVIMGGLILPWQGRIAVPALLQAGHETMIYPPAASRIAAIEIDAGQFVTKGDILFRLESPDLEREINRLETRIHGLKLQIARGRGSKEVIRRESVILRQLASAFSELEGLKIHKQQLTVRALVRGQVMEINSDLRVGLWVSGDQPLAILADTMIPVGVAYIGESDLRYVEPGDKARFYPHAPDMPAFDMMVSDIHQTSTQILTDIALASPLGGEVVAYQGDQAGQRYIPENAVFRMRLEDRSPQSGAQSVVQSLRGTAYIDGQPRSILGAFWSRVWGVFIRESGF